jgi:hypothetical protein
MKNKLSDLNDHLFSQLERLGDEDLKGDKLQEEIDRSKAIQGIASAVIGNARLVLDAEKFKTEYNKQSLPDLLTENKPVLKAIKNG